LETPGEKHVSPIQAFQPTPRQEFLTRLARIDDEQFGGRIERPFISVLFAPQAAAKPSPTASPGNQSHPDCRFQHKLTFLAFALGTPPVTTREPTLTRSDVL
jgi:hypothetical protein